MSQFRNALLIACSLAAASGSVRAEDQGVVHRLSSNGGLSSTSAKKLAAKIGQRMARAADAPPSMPDPVRAALSQALTGSPMPTDAMATAKVRLKLYAGLNEVALEALFAPQPGAIASCVRDIEASQSECEALVAAAARSSVSQVRSVAGGPAAPPPMAAAPAQGAGGGSRFGGSRYQSGYQAQPRQQQGFGGGYQAPQQQGYAARPGYGAPQQGYGARPGYGAQQQGFGGGQQQGFGARPGGYQAPQQGYGARPAYAAPQQQGYAARPSYGAPQRPAAPAYAAPAPAPVSQQDMAARKDAYKAQREAYLARQKQQFQDRRDKSGAALDVSGEAPAASAAAAPAAAPAPAPSAKPAKGGKAAPAPSVEEELAAELDNPAPAKADSKPALDNDFLDGLLEDPLGGKGKKK